MQIKALSTFAISLSATAVFAVANVAFAEGYENKDNISSISVTATDTALDPSDIKTRQVWDVQSEGFVTATYYDIYDYSNLTLTVNYLTGEVKSYTGKEIATLSAKTEAPFIISDNQSEETWTMGTHTVTCYFGGKSSDISFTVEESRIKSVTVTPQYDIKFIYGLDGEIVTTSDSNGIISEICRYPLSEQYYEISISYVDGNTARYTNAEIEDKKIHSLKFVQPDGILDIGTHTASCYVDGIKADFSFEITQNSIQEISLTLPDGKDTLTFSKDGITDTDNNGKLYPRFFYDVSSIKAKITYKDGTTSEMPSGQLCRDLQDKLIFEDKQKSAPWQTDKITLNASIRNIPCTLTLNITTESISNLKAETSSPFSAKLSWDRVYSVGYEIWKINGKTSEKVTDIPFGTEAVTINSLSPDTRYTYAVRSYIFDEKGERKYTDTVTTEFTTPSWNANIAISDYNSTDDSIEIFWNKSNSADGYVISVNGKQIATTDKDTDSYTIDGLTDSSLYTIGIKAYKVTSNSTFYSKEISAKIYTIPSLISGFKPSSRTTTSVTLKWDANINANGYKIERYINGAWSKLKVINSPQTTSYKISGLTPTETLDLRIRAFKIINGKYVYGDAVSYNTLSSPSAVKNLKETTRTSASSTIKWTENTSADGYIVNIYKDGKWVTVGRITDSRNTTFTVKNLTSAASHNLYVKAYKKYGQSIAYSSPTKITVYTNPTAVSGFKTSSRTTSSVSVKWNLHTKADGYIINRYENGKWVRIKTSYSPSTTAFTIKGLSQAEKQKLYIKAFTIVNGKYLFSAPTKLDTLSNPVTVKNLHLVKRTSSSITIKWDKNKYADGYIVNRLENGKWVRVKTIRSADTTSITIKGLSPAETQNLYVKAYATINGTYAFSAPQKLSTFTCPATVKNLRTTKSTTSSVTLKWDRNEQASGYIVNIYKDGKWKTIKRISGKEFVSYTVNGLSSKSQYKLYVKAYKTVGSSTAYSDAVKITVNTR